MRCFVGFTFPERENVLIETLRHEIATRFSVQAAIRTPPHITVLRKMEVADDVERLQAAIAAVFSQTSPLTVRVNGYSSFDQSTWFLEIEQAQPLANVHRKLTDIAYRLYRIAPNRPVESKRFHVTLAYKDVGSEAFASIGAFLKARPLPIDELKVETATLFVDEGGRWKPFATYRLGP